ncbi:MAG: protein-L-isoaspartate(D-aspartate) O-methyltransferase [Actinomycetota bacterium]|nr:protein-L-isoaspartate(D-aspartate) O-methyltransferase [Actinomycetota bacterium]
MSTPEDLLEVLQAQGIGDRRLLQAFRRIPRAHFVPPHLASRAYLDQPLPIPHDQVTTQPSLSARMIEVLRLEGHEHVLEVGTGYGFQTALLAATCRFVSTVERWPDLAETARQHLRRQGMDNVEVVVGDGTEGLPERAPFQAVLVSAAFPQVPPPLVEQLALGGWLVQPIGSGGNESVVLFARDQDGLVRQRAVTAARFVRLYGTHGFGASSS